MDPNNNITLDRFLKLTKAQVNTYKSGFYFLVDDPPFEMVDITSVKIRHVEILAVPLCVIDWQSKSCEKYYTSVKINDYMRIIRQDKLANILKQ